MTEFSSRRVGWLQLVWWLARVETITIKVDMARLEGGCHTSPGHTPTSTLAAQPGGGLQLPGDCVVGAEVAGSSRGTAPRSRPSAGKQLKSTGPRPGPRSCVSTLVDDHLCRLLAPCGMIVFAAVRSAGPLTQDGAQLATEMFPGLKLSECCYAISTI